MIYFTKFPAEDKQIYQNNVSLCYILADIKADMNASAIRGRPFSFQNQDKKVVFQQIVISLRASVLIEWPEIGPGQAF